MRLLLAALTAIGAGSVFFCAYLLFGNAVWGDRQIVLQGWSPLAVGCIAYCLVAMCCSFMAGCEAWYRMEEVTR